MGPYDDLLTLPHHQSATHPHMRPHDRAAQFSPFAALTGYEEVIEEAGRQPEPATDPAAEYAAEGCEAEGA